MPNPTDDVRDHMVRQGDRLFLRTPEGELLEMFGYGGGPQIDLDPRIDLCKPIYEQAQRLLMEDARRSTGESGEAA